MAQGAIAELAPTAIAKNIDLELEAGPSIIVPGDARLLGILLRNLIDNAIRYSPADTVVRVALDQKAGQPFLAVLDQGPGVAAAERDKLGGRFHRLAGTDASGTGLGLSIAKRIATLHAASMTFSETMAGKGLQVVVSFPQQRI